MKLLILVVTVLFSSLIYADDDGSIVDINVISTPLSAVAELINSKCADKIEPIIVKNAEALVSLNFDQMPCETAAAVVQDFDTTKKES